MPTGIYIRTEKIRKALALANKGNHPHFVATQFKKGGVPWIKGRKMTEGTRKKQAKAKIGKKREQANNWRGGISFHPQYMSFSVARRRALKHANG